MNFSNATMGTAHRRLPSLLRLAAFCLCLPFYAMLLTPAHGAVAAADQGSGYSGLVLGKVIQYWQPPADSLSRTAHVQVRIDAEGHVSSCVPTAPSGNPALDASACAAVKAAGNFAPPPYNLPIDIFLHFWTGRGRASPDADWGGHGGRSPPSETGRGRAETQQAETQQAAHARQNAPERRPDVPSIPPAAPAPVEEPAPAPAVGDDPYVNQVMEEIRTRIRLPKTLTGEHVCTVRLLVDAKGKITRVTPDGDGKSEFERAILRAVQKTGKAPPPPGGKAQELALTFILEKP